MRHLKKFNSRVFESEQIQVTGVAEELKKTLEDQGVQEAIKKLSPAQATALMHSCAEIIEAARQGEFDGVVTERRSYRGYRKINEGKEQVQKLANKFQMYGFAGALAGAVATGICAVAFGTTSIVPDAAKDGLANTTRLDPSWYTTIPALVITGLGLIAAMIGIYMGEVIVPGMEDER